MEIQCTRCDNIATEQPDNTGNYTLCRDCVNELDNGIEFLGRIDTFDAYDYDEFMSCNQEDQ